MWTTSSAPASPAPTRNSATSTASKCCGGPQGTLYGRNTLAGAIKIISRKPGDTLWANASAQYGSYKERVLKGSIGGPLQTGSLAGSAAFVYHAGDGYIFNRALGRTVGDYDNVAARFKLRYYGSETFTAELSAFGSRDRNDGYNPIPIAFPVTPATSDNVRFVAGRDTTLSPTPARGATDQYGASADLEWRFGPATLRSISAYVKVKDLFRADFTGGIQVGPSSFIAGFDRTAIADTDQYSQELQLTGSALDDRFNWIVGAFVFRDETTQTFSDILGGTTKLLPTTLNLTTDGYAAYVQGTYKLTDRISATAGIRYSLDDKKNDATIQTSFASFTLTPVNIARDFSAWTPKLASTSRPPRRP